MQDLEAYQDKFSDSGKRILESALNETRKQQKNFIVPENILYALMIEEKELFESTMKSNSIDAETVRSAVGKRLEKSRQHIGLGFRIAPETTEIFKFSMDRARSQGRRIIDAEDIISVFLTVKRDLFDDILQNPKGNKYSPNFFKPANPFSQSEFEAKQLEIWQKFHEEQKKFLSNISWEEVIKNNKLLSILNSFIGGGGGSGGGGSQISQNGISYHQSTSSHFVYQLNDNNNLNLAEIIESLKDDVEECLKQKKLEIVKTELITNGFCFEYKGENLTGNFKLIGEITIYYFQISVNQSETSVRKK